MTSHANFSTVADRVFTAYEHGHYEEALDIVRESAPGFPIALKHSSIGKPARMHDSTIHPRR